MPRQRWLAALLALPLAAGAEGVKGEVPADPLRSPACLQALDGLRALESSSAARAPAAGLNAAQRQAASACLGNRADARPPPEVRPTPARLAEIDPADSRPQRPAVTPRAPAPLQPPPPAARPPPLTAITTCDSAGCWASDGSRLNRIGPTLWGPRGACTVTGAVVTCP